MTTITNGITWISYGAPQGASAAITELLRDYFQLTQDPRRDEDGEEYGAWNDEFCEVWTGVIAAYVKQFNLPDFIERAALQAEYSKEDVSLMIDGLRHEAFNWE